MKGKMRSVAISSRDPTPRIKDPETDDPVEIFTSQFAYEDVPYMTSSSLVEFIGKPTLKNARRVLKSYEIPEPLKTLTRDARRANNHKQGGGMDKAISKNVLHELLAYDTLYDLLKCNGDSPQNIHKSVLGALSKYVHDDIPREHKTLFMTKDHKFTRVAYEYLRNKANVPVFKYNMATRDEKKNIDRVLYERLMKMKNMDVVLDNVMALSPETHTEAEANIGYVTCAFMLCLLTNMYRLHPETFREPIKLYDGLFMRFDGAYVRKFVSDYIKSVKRCTKAPEVQVMNVATSVKPEKFNDVYGVNAYLEEDKVHIHDKAYKIVTRRGNACDDNVTYPHDKKKFCEYMNRSMSASDKRDLCLLNFLRDAYKADVALNTGAMYITHDMLAYLYYRLIGGKRGVLIATGDWGNRLYSVIV